MKLLLIEDDPNKAKNLSDFLTENFLELDLKISKSYQSGLKSLIEETYELVLLDMQLPTFDIKSGEDGHKFRRMAGFDILREIKRKGKRTKVIIVTQFETFGEGESFMDLSGLKNQLIEKFPEYYVDTVFYDAKFSAWRENLRKTITQFNKANG